jgi:hypothetical protein
MIEKQDFNHIEDQLDQLASNKQLKTPEARELLDSYISSRLLYLWIAILIVQQPKDIQLSTLKISNQEKATIKKWVTLIQTLPKIQSKQSLITLVYDDC